MEQWLLKGLSIRVFCCEVLSLECFDTVDWVTVITGWASGT